MARLTEYNSLLRASALLTVVLGLASCSSTPGVEGVPSNLPDIPLYGSASTPPHSMAKGDYPFDSNGNYVTAWAAMGSSASSSASSGHAEELPPAEPESRHSRNSKSRVEEAPPEPAPKSSRNAAGKSQNTDLPPPVTSTYITKDGRRRSEDVPAPTVHKGGAAKPKSDDTAAKKTSPDSDSPRPKKKTTGDTDAAKSKKKSSEDSDSPKPKKKTSGDSDAAKPKKKSSEDSDSPKPKKKTTGNSDAPKPKKPSTSDGGHSKPKKKADSDAFNPGQIPAVRGVYALSPAEWVRAVAGCLGAPSAGRVMSVL